MNALDRLVGWLSPEQGLRRAYARALYERSYAGAASGVRPQGFGLARASSPTAAVSGSIGRLRDRTRMMIRDTPHAAAIMDAFPSLLVGTGILPRFDTGSDRDDRLARDAFRVWSEGPCDAMNQTDWGGLQIQLVRAMIEGGESVALRRRGRYAPGGPVPLRYQILEGDLIDDARDDPLRTVGAERNRAGKRIDAIGAPIGTWLLAGHPGEVQAPPLTSILVPRGGAHHLFRILRPGQLRGVTWFAPILLKAREFDEFMEAVIVKARVEAAFAGFIHGENAPAPGDVQADRKTLSLEPGTIQRLGDGEQITFAQPSTQTSFEAVSTGVLQAMAIGVGLSYDEVTGDLSKANYSSLRKGAQRTRRLVEQIQWTVLVPGALRPMMSEFVDMSVLSGVLPARRHGWRFAFTMPAVESIDPLKDMQADILAVRSGRMSPQDFIEMWGHDWRTVMEQHRDFFEWCRQNGVVLDLDPGLINQKGSAQPGLISAPDGEPGATGA